MSRQSDRITVAAADVIDMLCDDEGEFSGQEIMAILDAARFAVMTNEFKQDLLGDDFIAESGGEVEEEDLARWEDDGGR